MNAPDKAKEIRGVVAAAIGFLTALWGWAGWAVLVWAALILIDYITAHPWQSPTTNSFPVVPPCCL